MKYIFPIQFTLVFISILSFKYFLFRDWLKEQRCLIAINSITQLLKAIFLTLHVFILYFCIFIIRFFVLQISFFLTRKVMTCWSFLSLPKRKKKLILSSETGWGLAHKRLNELQMWRAKRFIRFIKAKTFKRFIKAKTFKRFIKAKRLRWD